MGDLERQQLDYEPVARPSRPFAWAYHGVILAEALAGWLLFAIVSFFVVPHFEEIFKGFKTELPGITRFFLALSRWCAFEYGWFWALSLVAWPVFLSYLVDRYTSDEARARTRLWWLILLLPLPTACYLVLVVVALMSPAMG